MTEQTGYPTTYHVGAPPQAPGPYAPPQQYQQPQPHYRPQAVHPTTAELQARLRRIEVVIWIIATMGFITMCVVLYFLYTMIRFAEALQQAFPATPS
jgi:hypothetical protein